MARNKGSKVGWNADPLVKHIIDHNIYHHCEPRDEDFTNEVDKLDGVKVKDIKKFRYLALCYNCFQSYIHDKKCRGSSQRDLSKDGIWEYYGTEDQYEYRYCS